MYESLLNFPGSLFGEFDRLRRDLDDAFTRPSSIRSAAPGAFPAINIGQTPASVEVWAFAPGLDASKLEVTIDRGVLTLSGERASPLPDERQARERKLSVYSQERPYGSFKRAVSLPDDVDPSRVEASYRDGVLQVRIARRESAQPRRISVQ
jgi:HSP20 family protein